ncbi:hypothetical protein N0V91_010863 [Didymella pomorum]|uniref:Uncharacterized protein n=1 Tax=Didymella pomorum TaxID=749634 RepID=A0A9W8YYH0_9PLEO|nr:hypothetical protein N0V91_010863 [Didymella pomorum]
MPPEKKKQRTGENPAAATLEHEDEHQNRTLGEDSKEDEDFDDGYKAGFKVENETGLWGYRELIENFIVEFEKAFKKADEDGLKHT